MSVFNYKGGPTYRCLFPEPPEPGTVPNCAETGVLGAVTGLIGAAQACEAIKVLTGVGEPLAGRLLIWDTLAMRTSLVGLRADPDRLRITELPPEGYGETCNVEPRRDEVDAAALRRMQADGRPLQIVDVREGWERELSSIDPSVHVPLGYLEMLPPGPVGKVDPTVRTVVYCAAGVRSYRAMLLLREKHRFQDVVSLQGGIKDWF